MDLKRGEVVCRVREVVGEWRDRRWNVNEGGVMGEVWVMDNRMKYICMN